MLTARFVHHRFDRHLHDTYTVAVIEHGVEEYFYGGATHRVGPGGMALIEPHQVHTGHAGAPEGWRYRALYPRPELLTAIARETGLAGTPGFVTSALEDVELAGHLRLAHRAAERGDRLAASSLLRTSLAHLLRVNARPGLRLRPEPAAGRAVADARDILHQRLVDPPRLEELAASVGASPFALLRAFRAAHGLPPHAYLNQIRVQHARALLATGLAVAEVAARTGFADQPHLTRHFKRHTGVPPGAYQRGMAADAPTVRPARGGSPRARTFKTPAVACR